MYEKRGSLHIFRISKARIKSARLILGRQPAETLESMYSRLDPKPDILVNANLFNMSDGWTLVSLKVDGQVIREKSARNYGYVVAGKGPEIKLITMNDRPFTEISKEFDWAFETAPLLLPTLVANQMDASIVNGRHPRTAIGFDNAKNEYVLLVTDGRPFGLTCAELSAELRKCGVDVAVNLDGGGSSKILYRGQAVNNQPEKRPIDAAIAIWLTEEPAPQPAPQKTFKIALDAGHGPDTPGKRSPDGTLREFQFNAPTARYVAEMLLNEYENVEVLYTFDDSRDVPLQERTDRANAWGADVFVSIHANASGDGWSTAQGIETYVYTTRPPAAVALANAVQRHLVRLTGRPNRGVKSADFHVLRETKMTAILVECGFMTNREEVELLKSDQYRRKCAEAIVLGIAETYGLKKKPVQLPDWSKEAQEAREWAVAAGITDGTRPKDPVTREEVWAMLYRFYKLK